MQPIGNPRTNQNLQLAALLAGKGYSQDSQAAVLGNRGRGASALTVNRAPSTMPQATPPQAPQPQQQTPPAGPPYNQNLAEALATPSFNPAPTNFSALVQAIAPGFGAFMQAKNQAAERQQAAYQQQELGKALAGLPPELQAIARIDPKAATSAAAQMATKGPPGDYTLGDTRYSGTTNQPLAQNRLAPAPERPQTQEVNGQLWERSPQGEWVGVTPPEPAKEGQPALVEEYNFAVTQGFKGTFLDYQQERNLARERADLQATAAAGAPAQIAAAQETLRLVDELLAHPGRAGATGPIQGRIPEGMLYGDAYDFNKRLDQLKGKAFLEAFAALKGAGAITDREGAAATEALARLDRAQSEEEFVRGVGELRAFVASRIQMIQQRAGQGLPAAAPEEARPGLPDGWTIQRVN